MFFGKNKFPSQIANPNSQITYEYECNFLNKFLFIQRLMNGMMCGRDEWSLWNQYNYMTYQLHCMNVTKTFCPYKKKKHTWQLGFIYNCVIAKETLNN